MMSSFSEGCCVGRTVVLQAFGNLPALSFSMCSSGDSVFQRLWDRCGPALFIPLQVLLMHSEGVM